MAFCTNCGSQTEKSFTFCSICGQEVKNKNRNNDIPSFQVFESKSPAKAKSKIVIISLILMPLLLCAGVISFAISHSSNKTDTNSMKASQIVELLVKNNLCTHLEPIPVVDTTSQNIDVLKIEKKTKEAYENDTLRSCTLASSAFLRRNNLKAMWFGEAMDVTVRVGDARKIYNSAGKNDVRRIVDSVVGENWEISFWTREAAYPGIFEYAKSGMSALAQKIGGQIAANYRPFDSCISVFDEVDHPFGEVFEETKFEYSDCLKFFPESRKFEYSPEWQD